MLIRDILKNKPAGSSLEVRGWVRTRRDTRGLSFIEVNDGSCLGNLQIIASEEHLADYGNTIKHITTGCSVMFSGLLAESPAKGQDVELRATRCEIIGPAPADSYPLQKKRHSFEFLREIAHLRPRTNSIGAVMRIRSRLSHAVHNFFADQGFFQIHTPIITTSDCEGAGEMFTVTTLEPGRTANTTAPYGDDFFGRQAGLTVSGQLEAEAYAMALGRVYTFGPTFRAENSNTSRHLAEFWMIEPEIAFCDLEGDMELAEKFLKHLIREITSSCPEDLELFTRFVDVNLEARLASVMDHDFARVTYTEAVKILEECGREFTFPVSWGNDLQSEHERFLTEEVFKKPLIVTGYPAAIKPFYMRVNDDGRTVAAMDILFPEIGEIIGGSQREERFEVLQARMTAQGIDTAAYNWYLDLRRYGSAPHAGFGAGFERIVQFVTGMTNIRDVIPFPRTPGNADY
ncbi:MAG: asparagine--tRNA ligase [Proteobacteria bacterium]|nr:asparagine--tRNA ligase [Pseudomonadota bacterium]MBU1738003.1 asparagine--tRNA ligase [Pseudomonadota bacterium]